METPLQRDIVEEFQPIFNPHSIAFIGGFGKGEGFVLDFFLSAGYRGKIFPVSLNARESHGIKTYPSVREIPEPVDYAIVRVPAAAVLNVIDDCVAKGVKVAQFFTAGFSEKGNEKNARLEKELIERAQRGGVRVIGPNCAGISVPANFIPLETTGVIGPPGDIAVLAQSGGNTEVLADAGISRGIRYSKLISFGNAADLNALDFLEYLNEDPETRIIGTYLEGISDGRRLYQLVARISLAKPVVFLKGGKTERGKVMVASHTASLAGRGEVWSAAMKQAGAIEVETLEEMADTLLTFQFLPPLTGRRTMVISQLGGGAGGAGVLAADLCTSLGLELPPFTEEALAKLKTMVNVPGAIVSNPLDAGAIGRSAAKLRKVLDILAGQADIDFIMLNERPTFLLSFLAAEEVREINEMLVDFGLAGRKPLIVVSPSSGQHQTERLAIERQFTDAGIPVYPGFDRAARAMMNFTRYWRWRESHNTDIPSIQP